MNELEALVMTADYVRKRGRRMDVGAFHEGIRTGKIKDARMDAFGDGYGEPYQPIRTVWGWCDDEIVWSEVEIGG